MPPVPDVADGCAEILLLLLRFLGGPSPGSPAVDEVAVSLLLVLLMAYVAGTIVARIAGVVLGCLHLATPATAPASATAASFVCPGRRFVVLLFVLVFAVLLAAFVFLRAAMGGIGLGFSWNVQG